MEETNVNHYNPQRPSQVKYWIDAFTDGRGLKVIMILARSTLLNSLIYKWHMLSRVFIVSVYL